MTASHILLQVTCFNVTESDFQNFRTNWTNFRTLSEFQDRAQACSIEQRTTDASLDQWYSGLKTCICAKGRYFKHMVQINLCRKQIDS